MPVVVTDTAPNVNGVGCVTVPVNVGLAANDVAFPTDVTTPVKFALVVTVAALPEIEPVIVDENVFTPAIVCTPVVITPLAVALASGKLNATLLAA